MLGMGVLNRPGRLVVTGFLLLLVGLALFSLLHKKEPEEAKPYFTIYLLGGSTAKGEPYDPELDIAKLTAYAYDDQIAGRPVRTVNLGQYGISIHDVITVLGKVRNDADAVLLYSGNNEFQPFDTRHNLALRARQLFDRASVTQDQHEEVLRHYEKSIDKIVDHFESRHIPLFLCTVAVNVCDWEPNRSVLKDPAHGPRIEALLNAGDRSLADQQLEDACTAYREIVSMEPTFALGHQRLADCYRRMRKMKKAHEHYREATDLDGNPGRVIRKQNEAIRRIARERNVPLVDVVEILETASADRLIGFDMMRDNCHPTLKGYALIAEGFARELKARLNLQTGWHALDPDDIMNHFGLGNPFWLKVAMTSGQYCYVSSSLTFNRAHRLDRARYYLADAEAIAPSDVDLLCNIAVMNTMAGDIKEARASWRKAHAVDAEVTRTRLIHPRVRELMKGLGIDNPLSIIR